MATTAATPAADPYDPVFDAAGQEWGVDPLLLKSIAGQESGGTTNPNTAVSPAGAQGKMQFMPATARAVGITDPNDPVQSIYGAAKLLGAPGGLLDTFQSPELALAAYNAGPGRLTGYTDKTTGQHVPGWLETIGDPRTGAITPQDFASRIPIAETANYIPSIGRRYQALAASANPQPPANGNGAPPPPPPPATAAADPNAGLAQPSPATSSATGSSPPPVPRVGGDSLAAGLAQYNGFTGGGTVSAAPAAVLKSLASEPNAQPGQPYWPSDREAVRFGHLG